MTFWEFFNNHPFIGFGFSVVALVCAASAVIDGTNAIAGALKAKWGGCDCVPCDLEHVEDDDSNYSAGDE